MLCGGVGDTKDANQEVHDLVAKVKPHVEGKLGRTLDTYTAVNYKTQVVAGTNFFVKVHTGDGKHAHLRIYRNLQGEVELHGVQDDKEASSPLEYF